MISLARAVCYEAPRGREGDRQPLPGTMSWEPLGGLSISSRNKDPPVSR